MDVLIRLVAIRGILLALSSLVIAGCGSAQGPALANVHGTVARHGAPVVGAIVMFIPALGTPSSGKTDEAGRFELRYNDGRLGAVLGKHSVSITIPGEPPEPPTAETPRPVGRLHEDFSREAEVKPGVNHIPFHL